MAALEQPALCSIAAGGGRVIDTYREKFIELLIENDAVRFGEFTLKSGRKSPYFINTGQLRTGGAIAGLGAAYAERILDAGLAPDFVFGPAYKGVPLAVTTAISLSERGRNVGFSFDRKETKDHGEGGVFVGTQPEDGLAVVIVDDVITTGASIEHSVKLLKNAADVAIQGVVVAVDRQERGRERSTLEELQVGLGVPILSVVTIREIVEHLSKPDARGVRRLGEAAALEIERHLELHGARARGGGRG